MSKFSLNETIIPTPNDYRIAWLTALAISIHLLESAFPSIVPGIKPGFANIIVVVVLVQYGIRSAIWVSLLRVAIGSIIIGSFLTPGFILSLTGAVFSLLMMSPFFLLAKNHLSCIGLSLIGSIAHVLGQFYVAYWLFIPHDTLFGLLPILLTAAIIFGLINGYLANLIVKKLNE